MDCGIVHLPVNTDWFDIIEIAEIHDCFVVGERYKHLAEGAVSLSDLFNNPMIVLSGNSHTRTFIEPQLREGTLHEVTTLENLPPRKVGIATIKGSPLSTATAKLIQLLSPSK